MRKVNSDKNIFDVALHNFAITQVVWFHIKKQVNGNGWELEEN